MSAAKRIEGFVFPHIYHTFQAKDKNSDQLINYYVQDVPEERFEEIVEFMVKYFLPFEAMCESKNVMQNEEVVEHVRNIWRDMLKNKVSLVCFKENCNEIIGANVLIVHKPSDVDTKSEQPGWKDVLSVIEISESQFNIFKHYKVDEYLYGFGLAVDPAYQGRGIATEILKARFPLMKTLNLTLTSTAFTGTGSQIAAKKAGFHDNLVLEYAEMHKYKPGLAFPGIKHKYFKVMSYKF